MTGTDSILAALSTSPSADTRALTSPSRGSSTAPANDTATNEASSFNRGQDEDTRFSDLVTQDNDNFDRPADDNNQTQAANESPAQAKPSDTEASSEDIPSNGATDSDRSADDQRSPTDQKPVATAEAVDSVITPEAANDPEAPKAGQPSATTTTTDTPALTATATDTVAKMSDAATKTGAIAQPDVATSGRNQTSADSASTVSTAPRTTAETGTATLATTTQQGQSGLANQNLPNGQASTGAATTAPPTSTQATATSTPQAELLDVDDLTADLAKKDVKPMNSKLDGAPLTAGVATTPTMSNLTATGSAQAIVTPTVDASGVLATPTGQAPTPTLATAAGGLNAPVATTQTMVPTVANSVANNLLVRPSATSIEVQLDPADLGRIRIDFDLSQEQTVRAVVSADNSETLSMLKRQSGALAEELQNLGLSEAEIDIEFQDDSTSFSDLSNEEDSQQLTDLSEDLGPLTVDNLGADGVSYPSIASKSGLDIRL